MDRRVVDRRATDHREAAWSRLHHGIPAGSVPVLRQWLRAMWAVGSPLAALRVSPTAITATGALMAVLAVASAADLPLLALALVCIAVTCDGLDGAVAVLNDRATSAGAHADAVADRIADAAFAAVLWRLGAPWWLAGVAGLLGLLHELARACLRGARLSRLTVSERPTRAVCTVLACGSAALTCEPWPATTCAAVLAALATIGLVQICAR